MVTTEIYIIKVISYRESSNLYAAIAKDYGKITLIHKGVRSNAKKNALELFIPYKVSWSGKSNIKFLREYEIIRNTDYTPSHNIIGMYYNELLYYLTKSDFHIEKLYEHYDYSLRSLLDSKNLLINLNNFEIGVLILTGHYIYFDRDTDDEAVNPSKSYSYIPDIGPERQNNHKDIYKGETLMALSGINPYNEKSIKESRVLMKRLIDYYIQPKKIKTREILKYISLK